MDYQNGVFHIGSSGEYVARIDGHDIGYASTHAAALRILSNERLARATHRHLEYSDLAAMRAAGTFAEYVRDLDDDGLGAVAHILVVGNYAAGRDLSYDDALATLTRIRDAHRPISPLADRSPDALIVAVYEPAIEQIVIRRGLGGEALAYCNTWIEVDQIKQRLSLV